MDFSFTVTLIKIRRKNHKLLTHSKNCTISFLLSEKKIKWLFLKLSVPIQKKNEPENLVV